MSRLKTIVFPWSSNEKHRHLDEDTVRASNPRVLIVGEDQSRSSPDGVGWQRANLMGYDAGESN